MNSDRMISILGWIETVVNGLGQLADSVVFVGGAITTLLLTDVNALRAVRPTKDLDVISKTTRSGFYKLEDELRKRGFAQRMTGEDPICRWHYKGVMIDVMPTDENILKFSNRWYLEAYESARWFHLPSGSRIRLITAPLFICTKLDAFNDRGRGHFDESHDLEDVVTLIDGRPELVEEVKDVSSAVQAYIRESFNTLLNSQPFMSSIEWNLPYGSGGVERVSVIESRMRAIADNLRGD